MEEEEWRGDDSRAGVVVPVSNACESDDSDEVPQEVTGPSEKAKGKRPASSNLTPPPPSPVPGLSLPIAQGMYPDPCETQGYTASRFESFTVRSSSAGALDASAPSPRRGVISLSAFYERSLRTDLDRDLQLPCAASPASKVESCSSKVAMALSRLDHRCAACLLHGVSTPAHFRTMCPSLSADVEHPVFKKLDELRQSSAVVDVGLAYQYAFGLEMDTFLNSVLIPVAFVHMTDYERFGFQAAAQFPDAGFDIVGVDEGVIVRWLSQHASDDGGEPGLLNIVELFVWSMQWEDHCKWE